MRTTKLNTLALALAFAFPAIAAAQATDNKKDPAAKPALATVPPRSPHVGMTPEQEAELNRVIVKTEALEDSRDDSGFKNLKISGYADVIYVYNKNRERGTFQFLVPIDKEDYAYDNSYMGTAALDVQKEMDGGTRFRLTIVPKRSSADVVYENSIVQEASVSIPLGSNDTRLIVGQLPDWEGYEYTQPTLNKLITHNLIFDFTTPDTYVGAGLELTRGDWVLKAMLINLSTSIRQVGEAVPVLVYRGDYSSSEYWGFGFAGIEGPKKNYRADDVNPVTGEAYETEDSWTDLFEVDGWYTRGDLTVNGQLSFGQQRKAAVTADPVTGELRDARWYGASLLASYKVTPRFETILRADYISNRQNGGGLLDFTFADPIDGVGPDQRGGDPEVGADRYAVSAGLGYAVNENTNFKLEYRFDGATKYVFGNKDAIVDYQNGTASTSSKYLKNNSLVAAGLVVFF